MVGRAKGRSMMAETTRLPDELVAHQDPGDGQAGEGVDHRHEHRADERQLEGGQRLGLVTLSQKPCQPPVKALVTTAATGSRTSRLR